jgi:hypothetical protein
MPAPWSHVMPALKSREPLSAPEVADTVSVPRSVVPWRVVGMEPVSAKAADGTARAARERATPDASPSHPLRRDERACVDSCLRMGVPPEEAGRVPGTGLLVVG